MELILGYILIAVTISAGATLDIGHPVISEREMPADIRFLHYTVFFVMGILVAPIFIPAMFSKQVRIAFILSLSTALFEQPN